MPAGRPIEYNQDYVTKAQQYLSECVDALDEFHSTRGNNSDTFQRIVNVKIPTIEGLAFYLKVSRETIYDWETKYDEFSDILSLLRTKQADALITNGLSGNYNPTIAKVLLTKHGYREGVDATTNDKDLPFTIVIKKADADKPEQGNL